MRGEDKSSGVPVSRTRLLASALSCSRTTSITGTLDPRRAADSATSWRPATAQHSCVCASAKFFVFVSSGYRRGRRRFSCAREMAQWRRGSHPHHVPEKACRNVAGVFMLRRRVARRQKKRLVLFCGSVKTSKHRCNPILQTVICNV